MRAHLLISALALSLLCTAAGRAPADVDNMTARQAYDAAFDLWAAGKQSDAEALLRAALGRHQADQRLLLRRLHAQPLRRRPVAQGDGAGRNDRR